MADRESGVKQLLWSLFQSESFAPNDSRVMTRRLSTQGLRSLLRRLGGMLVSAHSHLSRTDGAVEAVGGDTGAGNADASLRQASGALGAVTDFLTTTSDATGASTGLLLSPAWLHHTITSEAFENRCWQLMVASNPATSSVNWTCFCQAFMESLKAVTAHAGPEARLRNAADGAAARQKRQLRSACGAGECELSDTSAPITVQRSRSSTPVSHRHRSPSAGASRTLHTTVEGAVSRGCSPVAAQNNTRATEVIELALSPLHEQRHSAAGVRDDDSPKIVSAVLVKAVSNQFAEGAFVKDPSRVSGPGGSLRCKQRNHERQGLAGHSGAPGQSFTKPPAAMTFAPGMPVFMPAPSHSQPQHSSPPRRPQLRAPMSAAESGRCAPSGSSFPNTCALPVKAEDLPTAATPPPTLRTAAHRSAAAPFSMGARGAVRDECVAAGPASHFASSALQSSSTRPATDEGDDRWCHEGTLELSFGGDSPFQHPVERRGWMMQSTAVHEDMQCLDGDWPAAGGGQFSADAWLYDARYNAATNREVNRVRRAPHYQPPYVSSSAYSSNGPFASFEGLQLVPDDSVGVESLPLPASAAAVIRSAAPLREAPDKSLVAARHPAAPQSMTAPSVASLQSIHTALSALSYPPLRANEQKKQSSSELAENGVVLPKPSPALHLGDDPLPAPALHEPLRSYVTSSDRLAPTHSTTQPTALRVDSNEPSSSGAHERLQGDISVPVQSVALQELFPNNHHHLPRFIQHEKQEPCASSSQRRREERVPCAAHVDVARAVPPSTLPRSVSPPTGTPLKPPSSRPVSSKVVKGSQPTLTKTAS